jgi:serine/threonine protein phosphatase PrpC
MFHNEYAGLSDIGHVREKNEDAWTAVPEMGLFIVSDGIGGNFAGEVASQIVVEALPKLLRERIAPSAGSDEDLTDDQVGDRIKDAICELSNDLRARTKHEPGLEGMGATVVIALVRDDKVHIAHMGDSRAYLVRDAGLKQLTHDHSLVQLLIDNEAIEPEEATTHPSHGQLTRSVGMEGEPLPEANVFQLQPGDRILLCTDGLTGMIQDQELCNLMSVDSPLNEVCQSLIAAANEAGGTDNITATIIAVRETSVEDADATTTAF